MPFGGSLLLPLQVFSEDAFPSTLPQEVDERFSTLLQQMLPQFVVDDHPLFVSFLRAYLEFTEQHGNPRAEAVRMNEYIDVDETLPNFLQFFKSQYLYDFPVKLYEGLNEQQIIKNIKEYYGEKGNPRSLDLLFRILFNSKVEVKFPRDQIIVASESGYEQRTAIKITRFNDVSLLRYIGSKVFQEFDDDRPDQGIRATAFVDSIEFREYDGIDYAELKLRDQFGKFAPNKDIIFTNADNVKLKEKVFEVISTALPSVVNGITQDGLYYNVGDSVIVQDSENKIVANLSVIDISSTGQIQKLSQANSSKLFFPQDDYTITIQSAGGTGASLEVVGGVSEIIPRVLFNTEKSQLSANAFLQNNFNYQEFSYVVSSDVQLASYAKLIKTLFHPAGSMLLGQFVFKQDFDTAGLTTDFNRAFNVPIFSPRIGNYLPYRIGMTTDLRGDTVGNTFADYYPTGYDGITARAVTAGNYDSVGNAITHSPFLLGDPIPTGDPIYGDSDGPYNPEFLFDESTSPPGDRSVIRGGYTVAAFPQTKMITSDNASSEFYIIGRHPNALLSLRRDEGETARVNQNYKKNTTSNKADSFQREFELVISSSSDGTGQVTTLTVGDTITQTQGLNPTAIGTITSIDQVNVTTTRGSGGKTGRTGLGSTPFDIITVIRVNVSNGSFISSSVTSATTAAVKPEAFPASNQDGVRFFIGGVENADSVLVGSSTTELSFGNVRIGDFLNRMQVPLLN